MVTLLEYSSHLNIRVIYETKYSRMDQINFVEDNL